MLVIIHPPREDGEVKKLGIMELEICSVSIVVLVGASQVLAFLSQDECPLFFNAN